MIYSMVLRKNSGLENRYTLYRKTAEIFNLLVFYFNFT